MPRKKVRLFVGIVDAGDQDVFEGKPLLFVRHVIVTSRKQFLDIITAIDRHNLIAHVVGRSVQ
jgi:hypothetical protein